MSQLVAISPGGRLRLVPDESATPRLDAEHVAALEQAFASSSADGLYYLVGQGLELALPPSLLFWRDFARRLMERLCQTPALSADAWLKLPSLNADEATAILESTPAMPGGEFLTLEALERLRTELLELIVARAERFTAGAEAFLQSVHRVWHAVGRVTFHLAENKRDEQRPFAFLATYVHRVSNQSKPQHLPLSDAVKQFAGAHQQSLLTGLLEPVQRGAEKSACVREMLANRSLFQPMAWTASQAHRFLLEADRMREAGIVLRLPDWWHMRRPPRPQVQVRIGQSASKADGLELLDFDVNLSLDGEPLTDDERNQILKSADQLVLLRGKWVEVDNTRIQQVLDHWELVREGHPEGVSFADGMRLLAGVDLGSRGVAEEGTQEWTGIAAGNWLRETLERIRQPGSIDEFQPGRDLHATLRPYQADGVRWLWFMTRLGLGACLADDMGLGKTIQVIDLLLQRSARRVEHWLRVSSLYRLLSWETGDRNSRDSRLPCECFMRTAASATRTR